MLTFFIFYEAFTKFEIFQFVQLPIEIIGNQKEYRKGLTTFVSVFFFFVCWVTLSLSLDVCVNAEAVNWLKLTPSVLSLNCLRVLIKTKLFKLCYIQNPYFKVIRSSLCCFLSLRSAHRTIFLKGILFCCQ